MIRVHPSAVAGAICVLGLASLLAQTNPPATELPGVLPAEGSTESFVVTADGQRTYYVNTTGEIWVFDRAQKTGARIASSRAWDLAVAPTRDALVYTRAGDKAAQQAIWVSPLDPKTGLAKGAERRLVAGRGDVPSVSPDGKRVAFARDDATGVGQSLVVVPISGGAERVIAASMPSSIDQIRWTPDGGTIYYGVNPPVACVPDWSCLPLPSDKDKDRTTASIRRVAATGGPSSVVVSGARSTLPGLSPDGTVIAYVDAANQRRVTVADATGKPLGSFPLAGNQTVSGWSSGSQLLVRASGNVRRLQLTSIAGAPPHALFESPDRLAPPAWSPDGKTLAAVRCSGTTPCELRLLNADGSPRHTVTLPETFVAAVVWSPDQRWISYIGTPPNQPQPRLVAVEVSTDRVAPLGDMKQGPGWAVFWLPDSQRLLVTDQSGSGAARRVSFRLVDLAGQSTPLRDLAVGDPPGYALPINASTAIVARVATHDFRLAPLSGDGPEQVLLAGYEIPVAPLVSADRQWLALRRSSAPDGAAGLNVIELFRADGSARTTIELPFAAAPGVSSLVILPGAKQLVVVESWRPDVDPGVYLVTVETKAVKKLFTYPSRPGRSGPPDVAVSADGSVAYMVSEAMTPLVSAIDVSVFRQPGR
jgi:Tol biopolymer transport system component